MEEKKKKFSFANMNGYALLFAIMLIMAILTWIIPAGNYDRVFDENTGRNLVVPGSFQYAEENSPVGPFQFIVLFFEGFVDAADIIFFIMFAGAYVHVLTKSGTLNAMTGAILRKIGTKDILIIPIFMLFFAVLGSTCGFYEEVYGLIPVFIVIAITLGYDRITGGAIVYVGVATGFAAATINPFTVGVASKIAEVSYAETKVLIFRLLSFIAFLTVSVIYTMRYAKKIKADPSKSITYGRKENIEGMMSREEVMNLEFTAKHKITIALFLVLIVVIVVGVAKIGWYFSEIAAVFFIAYLLTCIINKYTISEIFETFTQSCKGSTLGALTVGFGRGISLVMTAGCIIDTAVFWLSSLVASLPTVLTGVGMLLVQNVINFFIPSGSGQAIVTMPIMTPLADVVGISRQMAVTAYHYGDGFSNMFWPTCIPVICGMMEISMSDWYKFVTKLFLILVGVQCIFMVGGVICGV